MPSDQRRTALSLDSSATELSFMAGPAIGVWLATSWDTGWALLVCELTSVAAGFVLWLVNPPLTSESAESEPARDTTGEQVAGDEPGEAARAEAIAASTTGAGADDVAPGRAIRGFITFPVAAVYLAAACSTLVLSGTDVSIVAALRSFEATGSIGWVLALWGAGSLVGGLLYGAWHRSFSVFWLLGGLAATTAPVALAVGVPSFAVLITVSGFLCAPTITATVEQLSRQVPERFRGEMMGWHGSAMTAGSAVGAPIAGFRHRPRRLAVGVRRRVRARRRHRGGGPRRLARRPAPGRPDRPPPIRSTGSRLLTWSTDQPSPGSRSGGGPVATCKRSSLPPASTSRLPGQGLLDRMPLRGTRVEPCDATATVRHT